MAFVFWKNVVSHYERDLLREIARQSGGEVVCAVEQDLPADRMALGWGPGAFGPVKLVRSDDRSTFDSLVARTGDTHIMTGFLYHAVLTDAFTALAESRAKIVFHSESVETGGFKGALRFVRDRIKAARFSRHVSGVLAIGRLGVSYFERIGFDPSRIIPFGYFVEPGWGVEAIGPAPVTGFRIVYSGQFIGRKGLDILLTALGRTRDLPWVLDMIGSGPQEGVLRDRAADLEIADRIRWLGAVAPGQMPAMLTDADLLVLPSRWDGWGVVVNEALAAGVPVVCTDRCGAACVVTDRIVGETVPAGDVVGLADVLRRRIIPGRITSVTRDVCRMAAKRVSPEVGARQFLEGLVALDAGSPPPAAPWLQCTGAPQLQPA